MLKLIAGPSSLCAISALCFSLPALAQPIGADSAAPVPVPAPPSVPASAVYEAPADVIAKIRDEGMNRSQVMTTIGYLTDVIGPRLTASPAMKRANEWTRDSMARWGLQNAHLEAWGPFGRGWTLQKFEASMAGPANTPLIACPKAWSPSTKGAVTGEVVYLNARRDVDLSLYKGHLRGKIVLVSAVRDMKAEFEPTAQRLTDQALAEMALPPAPQGSGRPRGPRGQAPQGPQASDLRARIAFSSRRLQFLKEEGAAVIVDNSTKGSGGTVFVAEASVPQDIPPANAPAPEPGSRPRRIQAYQPEAEARMLPQMTMATEHYNRLMRMLQRGERVTMTVNIQAQYQNADKMGYNTIAEIPGTDLKDEVVMLGGHMDSWQSGTGATDNAAGVGVAMEAARIIQALGLRPRRTIRVALWSGEEQGLFGSAAYVKAHFADSPAPAPRPTAVPATPNIAGAPGAPGTPGVQPAPAPAERPALVKTPEYDKFSAYFNMDNGTGRFRGIYAQGNTAAAPILGAWLRPFADLSASTLTLRDTGSTDHISFDQVGLPGFQFIQDDIDYFSRTHHSNQDVFDRIQADDVKQAAVIMAAFVYQAAMMDEKMPRKPLRTERP